MKKLKLEIETLVVESFSMDALEEDRGTVLAHSGGSCNTYNHYTCAEFETCGAQFSCYIQCTNLPVSHWLNDDPGNETDCCTIGCG